MVFTPKTTDYTLSPYTGLTRESWLEAAHYLLEGVFTHVKAFTDPVIVPRNETAITYPHLSASPEQQKIERRAEVFEGLARSFFLAAPLIHNDRNATCGGILLRDYYKTHILRACTKGDALYIGSYEDLRAEVHADPTRCFQQTVETAALVIGLHACKAEIWDAYTKAEKDAIAALISSFAHAPTAPQNWRLFNMLDLAFLHAEGYEIDEEIMLDHASSILAYYAGDGWYRDGQNFDYYSAWVFQLYTPIWNVWYGYERMPKMAAAFEENARALMETYLDFFDEDGFMNAWGRSMIYRYAAVAPFYGNALLKRPSLNFGNARRVASGCLLQFLSREDFLVHGVPALGFYGQFSPLVQGYSCAESVLWMDKVFLLLLLSPTHPFWAEKEHSGTWEALAPDGVKTTALNGPALAFSNHKANGTTILRSGKVVKPHVDHDIWCYGKLCYATKYPWESGNHSSVESQQYVLEDEMRSQVQKANATFWAGERKGVLYRRQFFAYGLDRETSWTQGLNLADFAVPYGIFRADRLRLCHRPVILTLGSFGFPDNGTQIVRKQKGNAHAVILKGYDATGRKKQLAFTVFDGWDGIELQKRTGTNPDSAHSIVPYAVARRNKQYGYEPYLLLSQTLTREDHEDFSENDLFPLAAVNAEDERGYGAYGKTVLVFTDGSQKIIDFTDLEGNLLL